MAAFPSVGLLDKFNRPDGLLGPNWTALTGLGATMPSVLNSAAAGGDGYKGALWTGTSLPDDHEVYSTVRAAGSAGVFFGLLFGFTGDSGYQVSYDPLTGLVSLARVDAGVATILDGEEYSPADGHILGGRKIEDTVTGWVFAGGVWTQVFEETDATYSGGTVGFHVFELGEPDLILDDFGGGAVGGPGTPPSSFTRPVLEGIPEIGRPMTSTPGAWEGDDPLSFEYQWQRNGVDLDGEEASDYTFTEDDVAQNVRCRVYALNTAGVAFAYSLPSQPSQSTEGLDDTLVAVDDAFVPVKMRVAVNGEWF